MASERIIAVGSIVAGEIHWKISPLACPWGDCNQADDRLTEDEIAEMQAYEAEMDKQQCLQARMDAAYADVLAEEWQDYFLDADFFDHGL
jgi:hypothetical protein